MNKKFLAFGVLGFFAFAMVSAAIIQYYGSIEQDFSVEQAVAFNCPTEGCTETSPADLTNGDTTTSSTYSLKSAATSPRTVELRSECLVDGVECADGEVDTDYVKLLDYSYSKIWTENGDVLVEVEDTNDGWLQWTYTAATPATTGKLKMTVEIHDPTTNEGIFGITTYDDGSHDGWYYFDATGDVRISDYDGANKIEGYEFVETEVLADSLIVRIKKTELDNTFKWKGFANFHLVGNWIELDQSGSPWIPTASATIAEEITAPFELQSGEELFFVVENTFTGSGEYTISSFADVVLN